MTYDGGGAAAEWVNVPWEDQEELDAVTVERERCAAILLDMWSEGLETVLAKIKRPDG